VSPAKPALRTRYPAEAVRRIAGARGPAVGEVGPHLRADTPSGLRVASPNGEQQTAAQKNLTQKMFHCNESDGGGALRKRAA
jgi:hypothetical protein